MSKPFILCLFLLVGFVVQSVAQDNWNQHVGKAGESGWRCHVIQPDPSDHGPDGINLHDWNNDGLVDVLVNFEEGKFSRLYFNPGIKKCHKTWSNWIEFPHGPCEDSGIGDLDNDGDIDYVANGGWVFFNPGGKDVVDARKWVRMNLFDKEQRVPLVTDVDGDGLNDLVVGAQLWFKQPSDSKHQANNWRRFKLSDAKWPMNCLRRDVDADGDMDFIIADRRAEIYWLDNPGKSKLYEPWPRKMLHPHKSMFIAVGDINGDSIEDIAIAGGQEGDIKWQRKLTLLIRTNQSGVPAFDEVLISQPCGNFPKGVAILDLDNDSKKEVVVIPKQGDLWKATYEGDPSTSENWSAEPISIPGAMTRMKMDNVYLADIDGDGDQDILTTEENGGWGVIWFENPGR